MSFKSFRSVLAAVLVTVFAVSLFPIPATSITQQPDSGARPRRGKNGQAGAKDAPAQTMNRTPQEAAGHARQLPPPQVSSGGNQASQQRQPDPFDSNQPPQQTAGRSGSRVQRRQEPPPFDRPPIGQSQDRNSQVTTSSESRPGGPPVLQRPPASDSRSDRSQTTTDVDGDQQERSSRRPPTLHRPSDGPPPQDRTAEDEDQAERSSAGQRPGANQPQESGDDEVIKLESTLVNIPLLVSDRSGRYIPQLSARDFALYEDGVEQEIASFGSEEVPFSVALLLDVSPSVQGNIQDIQDAAIAFVRQLRQQDRVMVISFDRSLHLMTDFTSNRRVLEDAIRNIVTGSGTSVYEAVFETVRRRMRSVDGRKAMILFSDGEDTTSSSATYDDAVNIVTESDVLVYGLRYPGGAGGGGIQVDPWPRNRIPQIPFPLPFPFPWPRRRRGPFTYFTQGQVLMNATAASAPQRRRGRNGDFMADITAAGGGPVYDAEKIGDLSRLASRIADELRHVYVLSYYPTNALSNGGYRSIRIRVRNRDDIAVRHRRGYNARDTKMTTSH